jgi:nucleotidyltransferase/DNA polymerase involved in DNA repair
MTRAIIHVDMDAFYAAVEQRDHPAYQGRPVIVGADPKEGKGRGVVAASSYEARAFGIRSAMPISRAYRLCPHAIFVPVRMDRYDEVSEGIFGILRRYTDLVEPLSIDEAFLDVTESTRLFGEPARIARRIRAEIWREERLTASVGVAPNKFIAKIASDFKKPDGFVVVRPEEIETFLQDLSVEYLWGVGKKTAATLQALGIKTIGELARWPEEALSRRLGTIGGHLHRLSRGIDDRPVIAEAMARSMGAETTFSIDLEDPRQIRQSILRLADRVSARLRREGSAGSTITLKLRFADFTTLTRSCTLGEPIALTEEIYARALTLFQKIPLRGRKVRLVGIALSKLTAKTSPGQIPLFPSDPRREKAAEAVDEIRRRFGEAGIVRGSLLSPKSREKRR